VSYPLQPELITTTAAMSDEYASHLNDTFLFSLRLEGLLYATGFLGQAGYLGGLLQSVLVRSSNERITLIVVSR
jgi:hypothetical protein